MTLSLNGMSLAKKECQAPVEYRRTKRSPMQSSPLYMQRSRAVIRNLSACRAAGFFMEANLARGFSRGQHVWVLGGYLSAPTVIACLRKANEITKCVLGMDGGGAQCAVICLPLDKSRNARIEFGQHHGPRNAREPTLRKNKQNNSKQYAKGRGNHVEWDG
jgi:hypothetical protein